MYRDRFRTTINVMCDSLGTILVDHLSKKDLAAGDMRQVVKIGNFSETSIVGISF